MRPIANNVQMVDVLAAMGFGDMLALGGVAAVVLLTLVTVAILLNFGAMWLQAYMSGADVSFASLIGMSLRQVPPRTIINAKIMGVQAGVNIDRREGMSTADLEAHFLAGGDVGRVVRAIVAADRSSIELDFDRAAAIDLAGRDVLEAVQTSVSPKVIDCPPPQRGHKATLSAVAKNGVELLIHARVTVRTNLDRLIGGATEETIIARVGQGIISAIGSAHTHMDVMGMPDRISKEMLDRGLDANTAFEIVSIDIADIDVGENIGARLQADQAEADTRMAQARAEARRAAAIARQQEMTAQVTANRAALILAEAEIPEAVAEAIRAGCIQMPPTSHPQSSHYRDPRTSLSLEKNDNPRAPSVARAEPTAPTTNPNG
jgi:uncharacterized protein YqfA (UPF0365 family)